MFNDKAQSFEQKKIGETGCLEPALEQNTNDDCYLVFSSYFNQDLVTLSIKYVT